MALAGPGAGVRVAGLLRSLYADVAAAIAAAYLVKLALDEVPPSEYVRRTLQFVDGISQDFHDAMLRVGHVVEWTDQQAALAHIGNGWIGEEAVSMATYCAIRHADDYVSAVRRAANIPGDSDSVACITGGLVAARLGLGAVPRAWFERLERLDYLNEVAARLAAKKASLNQ